MVGRKEDVKEAVDEATVGIRNEEGVNAPVIHDTASLKMRKSLSRRSNESGLSRDNRIRLGQSETVQPVLAINLPESENAQKGFFIA